MRRATYSVQITTVDLRLDQRTELVDGTTFQVVDMHSRVAFGWLVGIATSDSVQNESFSRWMSSDRSVLFIETSTILRGLDTSWVQWAGGQVTDLIRATQQMRVGVASGKPQEAGGHVVDGGHFDCARVRLDLLENENVETNDQYFGQRTVNRKNKKEEKRK